MLDVRCSRIAGSDSRSGVHNYFIWPSDRTWNTIILAFGRRALPKYYKCYRLSTRWPAPDLPRRQLNALLLANWSTQGCSLWFPTQSIRPQVGWISSTARYYLWCVWQKRLLPKWSVPSNKQPVQITCVRVPVPAIQWWHRVCKSYSPSRARFGSWTR